MASTTSRYTIVPATTAITNTVTETAFSKYLTIPGYELRKASLVRFGAVWKSPSTNSTDTLTVKLYLGTVADNTGLLLADSGALDVANNNVGSCEGFGIVNTFGGASTGIFSGMSLAVPVTAGTIKATTFSQTEAQLDFLSTQYLVAMATWSVASASNQVQLDALWCEVTMQAS